MIAVKMTVSYDGRTLVQSFTANHIWMNEEEVDGCQDFRRFFRKWKNEKCKVSSNGFSAWLFTIIHNLETKIEIDQWKKIWWFRERVGEGVEGSISGRFCRRQRFSFLFFFFFKTFVYINIKNNALTLLMCNAD